MKASDLIPVLKKLIQIQRQLLNTSHDLSIEQVKLYDGLYVEVLDSIQSSSPGEPDITDETSLGSKTTYGYAIFNDDNNCYFAGSVNIPKWVQSKNLPSMDQNYRSCYETMNEEFWMAQLQDQAYEFLDFLEKLHPHLQRKLTVRRIGKEDQKQDSYKFWWD